MPSAVLIALVAFCALPFVLGAKVYPRTLDEIAEFINFRADKCPHSDINVIEHAGSLGLDLHCAQLTVPSDWFHPNRTVQIFLRRLRPSSGPASQRIFFVPDGPGQYLDAAEFMRVSLANYRNIRAEILMIDHRGCGLSNPLTTPNWLTSSADLATSCQTAKRMHPNFKDFASHQAIMDYLFVIDRLHYQVPLDTNLHGIGYGGYLIQRLLQLSPRGLIQRVILQDTLDTRFNLVRDSARGKFNSLQKLISNCHLQFGPNCPITFHSVDQLLAQIRIQTSVVINRCIAMFAHNMDIDLQDIPSSDILENLINRFVVDGSSLVLRAGVLLHIQKLLRCNEFVNDPWSAVELSHLSKYSTVGRGINIDETLRSLIGISELLFDGGLRAGEEVEFISPMSILRENEYFQELRRQRFFYHAQYELPYIMDSMWHFSRQHQRNNDEKTKCLFLVGSFHQNAHRAKNAFERIQNCDWQSKLFVIESSVGGSNPVWGSTYIQSFFDGSLVNNLTVTRNSRGQQFKTQLNEWPNEQRMERDQTKSSYYLDWIQMAKAVKW